MGTSWSHQCTSYNTNHYSVSISSIYVLMSDKVASDSTFESSLYSIVRATARRETRLAEHYERRHQV